MSQVHSDLLADPAAFRSVFAGEGEPLVLILAEQGQKGDLRRAIDAVGRLRKGGARPRPLVYGGSSAALLEGEEAAAQFLEPWARPLLPAVLGTVDAVVPLARQSERLLSELRKSGATMPPLLDLEGPRPSHAGTTTVGGAAAPPLARFLLRNDWGIGDELLLSGVAREIIRANPGTEVWIRSRFGFRFPSYVRREPLPPDAREVETIYQNASLYSPGAHSPFPGHLVQQMLDKVALDTGVKVRAVDLRPELDLRDPGPRRSGSVILHSRPNPRLPSKDWGIPRWRKLNEILLAAGVQVRQVGGREEPLLPGVEDLRGVPPGELPEVFAESSAVVCVVGFLMHLAEATRTPAVVIYGGREHPAIDGYPDQTHLSSGSLACRGRWGCHLAPDLDCPNGMKCMEDITPDGVAREVFRTLSERAIR